MNKRSRRGAKLMRSLTQVTMAKHGDIRMSSFWAHRNAMPFPYYLAFTADAELRTEVKRP